MPGPRFAHTLLSGRVRNARAALAVVILGVVLAIVHRMVRSRAVETLITEDTAVKGAVVHDKRDALLEAPVCRPCRHSCRATSRTYRQVSYRVSESA